MEAVMKKILLALGLAGTLMAPSALGSENINAFNLKRAAPAQSSDWNGLPLPPVPYLETMPWLTSGALWKDPQLDSSWRPDLDKIGPFNLNPTLPEGWLSRTGAKAETSNNG
jgi:hypothetical protein